MDIYNLSKYTTVLTPQLPIQHWCNYQYSWLAPNGKYLTAHNKAVGRDLISHSQHVSNVAFNQNVSRCVAWSIQRFCLRLNVFSYTFPRRSFGRQELQVRLNCLYSKVCFSNHIMKQKYYNYCIMYHGTVPYAEQVLNCCLFKGDYSCVCCSTLCFGNSISEQKFLPPFLFLEAIRHIRHFVTDKV